MLDATVIKLLVSAVAVLPFILFLEGAAALSPRGLGAAAGIERIVVGSGLLAVFQLNWTWLSLIFSGVALGVIGSTKVIPQWLLQFVTYGMGSVTAGHPATSVADVPLVLVGTLLVLVASLVFALDKAAHS